MRNAHFDCEQMSAVNRINLFIRTELLSPLATGFFFAHPGGGLSVASHAELAGRPVRVQRTAADCRRVHGVGDETRQDSGTERFAVHRRVRLQCGDNKRHCRRAGQSDFRSGDPRLRHHHRPHINLDHGHTVAAVRAEDQRHLGRARCHQQRSDQPQHGPEDGVQHETLPDRRPTGVAVPS